MFISWWLVIGYFISWWLVIGKFISWWWRFWSGIPWPYQEISFRIKLVHGDCCYQLVPLLDLSTHPVTLTYNIELFDASTGDEGRGKQSRKRHSIMRSVVSTCFEAIGQHKCVINPTYIISNWSRTCTRDQLRTLTTPNKLHKDTWFRHTNYSDYNHGNMSPWSVNSGRGPLRIRLGCVGSAAAPSVVNSGQCINPFDHLIGWPLLYSHAMSTLNSQRSIFIYGICWMTKQRRTVKVLKNINIILNTAISQLILIQYPFSDTHNKVSPGLKIS